MLALTSLDNWPSNSFLLNWSGISLFMSISKKKVELTHKVCIQILLSSFLYHQPCLLIFLWSFYLNQWYAVFLVFWNNHIRRLLFQGFLSLFIIEFWSRCSTAEMIKCFYLPLEQNTSLASDDSSNISSKFHKNILIFPPIFYFSLVLNPC